MRLLQTTTSTLSRKSGKEEYLPLRLAAPDDRLDDVRPDVPHGGEAEEDDVVALGGEVRLGLVDVGREDLDAHAAALVEVDRRLVLVVLDGRQQRRHVLGRVVGLQVRRPVRHQAVRGGVGLVEGVPGEGDQHVPQGLDGLVAIAVLPGARLEDGEVLRQLLGLLLAHDAAEDVGLAERVAGDDLGGLLHLLLVDDQAVGDVQDLLERLLQLGVDRGDLLLAVLAQRVVGVGVHAHRARPVQGRDGGDVLEVVGLHQPQQRAHGPAVELEDAERVAALEQFEGRGVVEREAQEVDVDPLVGLHHLDGVVHDREVAQAQEVHLQQAERLAARVVPLGDGDAVGVPHPDGDVVGDGLAGHDHTGGVHAHLADQALHAARCR